MWFHAAILVVRLGLGLRGRIRIERRKHIRIIRTLVMEVDRYATNFQDAIWVCMRVKIIGITGRGVTTQDRIGNSFTDSCATISANVWRAKVGTPFKSNAVQESAIRNVGRTTRKGKLSALKVSAWVLVTRAVTSFITIARTILNIDGISKQISFKK